MSRPASGLPRSSDHEQHDVLLVAQFAANDPLDESQQGKATYLVSGCAQCANLAADLRAVAGAVAWEPVPPRRRDFRITAEQAQLARGSAMHRFMRRLALPQADALRPIAAGVMSLGLVLVVAGNFWPAGGMNDSAVAPASAPTVEATFGAATTGAAVQEGPRLDENMSSKSTPAPAVGGNENTLTEFELLAPAQASGAGSGDAADRLRSKASERVEGFADDVTRSELAGQAPAGAAQDSDDSSQKRAARASQPEAAEDTAAAVIDELLPDDAVMQEAAPLADPNDGELRRNDGELRRVGSVEGSETDVRSAAETPIAPRLEAAGDTAAAVDSAVANKIGDEAIERGEGFEADAMGADLRASPLDEGIGFQTVLIVVGMVLAAGGLMLLLLVWLARRRHPDPIAR